ncbi:hypothetical protein ES705_13540 [subsurface metagenome]
MEKKRIQWKRRFVREYLQAVHSGDTCYGNVALGSIPAELQPGSLTEPELRMIQAVRCPRVDAVVLKPDRAIIVKAGVVADYRDIVFLPFHTRLFQYTRQLVDYWDLPVELRYVCSIDNEAMRIIAQIYNVNIVHFRPEWLDYYLNTLPPNKRRSVCINPCDLPQTADVFSADDQTSTAPGDQDEKPWWL